MNIYSNQQTVPRMTTGRPRWVCPLVLATVVSAMMVPGNSAMAQRTTLMAPPTPMASPPNASPPNASPTQRSATNIAPSRPMPSTTSMNPFPNGVPAVGAMPPPPTLAAPGGIANYPQTARPQTVANGGYVSSDTPLPVLASASWTHQPAAPMRVFNVHDIVTVRVDEIAQVTAEGEAETRKRTFREALLTDWIRLSRFRIFPDPQLGGDPALSAEGTNDYRAEATVETRESLTFNIAAKIVDIRPNGTIILEARKAFRHNDNLWETFLSGTCRVADIGPDNTILSRDLSDLEIRKEDRGHLREGYRRGWLTRFLDRNGPF